jgi:protein-disulfide isomerase
MSEEMKSSGTQDEAKERHEQELRFRRSHVYAALLPLAFVVGLATGFLFWGRSSSPAGERALQAPPSGEQAENQPPIEGPQPPPAPGSQEVMRLDVSVDDDPALGPDDAPITIIEFSDFACQFCRRFHQETFQLLMDAYPGQIRFVYRDFPVVGGFEAAQAAECADEQGFFWEYHDLLFTGTQGLSRGAYEQYAEDLGMDTDVFTTCLDEERYKSEVTNDANYASSLGISGTPTFFINGIPLVGAQPLGNFKQVIDGELDS